MTRETVSKNQSAFMIDLQQIAVALNSCTRRSLIVIDEFGKGTDTCDGAGLAAGVFLHLTSLGNEVPKVLAATHFHEIFDIGLFENNPRIAFAHMQVHLESEVNQHDHVTYLYQLKEGRSNLSYGTQCAAMNGIPKQIVDRAADLSERLRHGEDLITVCSAIPEHEFEDLAEAERIGRAFLEYEFEGEQEDVGVMLKRVLGMPSGQVENFVQSFEEMEMEMS
jgi:DNA mismatch repair protein MSH5